MSDDTPTPVTVLLSLCAWKEVDTLPWVRLASLRERREFIKSLREYTRHEQTPEELYTDLQNDGRRRYVLVVLLDDAPKCILKKAAALFRLRDICG